MLWNECVFCTCWSFGLWSRVFSGKKWNSLLNSKKMDESFGCDGFSMEVDFTDVDDITSGGPLLRKPKSDTVICTHVAVLIEYLNKNNYLIYYNHWIKYQYIWVSYIHYARNVCLNNTQSSHLNCTKALHPNIVKNQPLLSFLQNLPSSHTQNPNFIRAHLFSSVHLRL